MELYYNDIEVGQTWESRARTITEADIVNFAGISGDFNPIHIDHEFAKSTPYRRVIAHGLLGMAVGSGLLIQAPPMRTLALLSIENWEFKEPIFAGDTIRVVTEVAAIEPRGRGRRAVVTWKRTILNQNDRVVQQGISKTLVEGRIQRGK